MLSIMQIAMVQQLPFIPFQSSAVSPISMEIGEELNAFRWSAICSQTECAA